MGKEKKRKHSSSSSDDSSSSDSVSEKEKKKLRKLKKKLKKEQRKTEKVLKKKLKEEKKKLKRMRKERSRTRSEAEETTEKEDNAADVPIELMEKSKAMAPMTKEEWEKKQSVIRRVLDEETGRYRLIKGEGEVLEEIVSRERHKEINRQATRADGEFFQTKTLGKAVP